MRRKAPLPAHPEATDPELPEVSQPAPLVGGEDFMRAPYTGMSVRELSELEARALCAREDIPVFWKRPASKK